MSVTPQTIAKSMSCLRPLDADGLKALGEKGKANPESVVTLKAKTVCEGQFRMQTYVRDLEPMLIDEPPHLLGEDNAPNPSEASLATLGACLAVGVHANATAQGIALTKLELELEDGPREKIDELIAHANVWSPVANTLRNNVEVEVIPA